MSLGRVLSISGAATRATGRLIEKAGTNMQPGYRPLEAPSGHRRLVPTAEGVGPRLGYHTFVAPSATLVGGALVGKNCSIWYGAVVRADQGKVKIGDSVSVGERTVVKGQTEIGSNAHIGANCVLNGCQIDTGAFIDDGTVVGKGAKIGTATHVGPGSVVTPGTVIPAGQYWAGNPASFRSVLTMEQLIALKNQSKETLKQGEKHDFFLSMSDNQRSEWEALEEMRTSKPKKFEPRF
uniref:Uncharacterized protein n=1 Tax=Arcella intermedia TaxID=1963864 RepID=A0A6B2LFN4_9EUKA